MAKLSFCVTVKNRSRVEVVDGFVLTLFPDFVRSLVATLRPEDDAELIVVDWGSTDWPLVKWLDEASATLPVHLVNIDQDGFSRGAGLNAAGLSASGDVLFFLDADMLLCRKVIDNGLAAVKEGAAYFPICYYFLDPDHGTGMWADAGYGLVMLSSLMFGTVGGWPDFRRWGYADNVLYEAISERYSVVRERVEGFQHQWHPPACERSRLIGQIGEPLGQG